MFVYADNAATTCVSKTAREAMMPYLTERYGNPSSLYAFAQIVTEDLANARATVAQCINAEPREIYFTSGGSEADNQAILSAAEARRAARARSTSSPPRLSITPCCTPSRSLKKRALRSRCWTSMRTA